MKQIDRIMDRVEIMLEAAGYRGAIKVVRLVLQDELAPLAPAPPAVPQTGPEAAAGRPYTPDQPRPLAVAPAKVKQAPAARKSPAQIWKNPYPASGPPVEIEPGIFRAPDGRGWTEWWAPIGPTTTFSLWFVKRVTVNDGKQVYWTFVLESETGRKTTIRFLRSASTAGRRWDEVLAVFLLRLGVPEVTNSDQFIGKSIRLSPDQDVLQSVDAIAKAMNCYLDCGELDA